MSGRMIEKSNAQPPGVQLGHDVKAESRLCEANVTRSAIAEEANGSESLLW